MCWERKARSPGRRGRTRRAARRRPEGRDRDRARERDRRRARTTGRAAAPTAAVARPDAARPSRRSARRSRGRARGRRRRCPRAARAPRRSSMQIGSSLALPLVITSGPPAARSSRWCSGVDGSIAPCRRWPGATPGASRPRSRTEHDRRPPGRERRGLASASDSNQRRAPRRGRGTITANGLSGRRFRARSRATAASSVASHARWNPPSPLIATISPRASSAAARSIDVAVARRSGRRVQQREPRAARGARDRLGVEAPVRRVLVLAPAVVAHRERAHRRPLAVVGQRLDDREPRAAVGAVDERVAVAPVARDRGAPRGTPAQVAASGETSRSPRRAVGRRRSTSNPRDPSASRGAQRRRPRARAAAPRGRAPTANASSAAGAPSAWISTTPLAFRTQPGERRAASASRQTNGRNPTPWTTPRTSIPARLDRGAASSGATAAASCDDRVDQRRAAPPPPRATGRAPAARSPTSTPRNTTRGSGPSAAASPTASASPSPCDDERRAQLGREPVGSPPARTSVPGDARAGGCAHRVHDAPRRPRLRAGPRPAARSPPPRPPRRPAARRVPRGRRAARRRRHPPRGCRNRSRGRGPSRAATPARRRAAGSAWRRRCTGRSCAPPSRPGG